MDIVLAASRVKYVSSAAVAFVALLVKPIPAPLVSVRRETLAKSGNVLPLPYKSPDVLEV
jgi:hypothetical protein